jgi:acetyltransferase-like isoleucine patch superfamily enzyme
VQARLLVAAVLALFPPRLHRWLGCRLLGWQADKSVYVGHSIVAARTVVLGKGSAIGSLNMIKGLEELRLADNAAIGHLNWISAAPLGSGMFPHSPKRHPALVMGEYAAVLIRHIVDCSDTVTLGDYATLGGYRSTVLTHSVNLVKNKQFTAPVTLHDRVAVMTNCVLMAGVSIAPRSIVSAGSVVNLPLTKELTFYRGNPAVAVRDLDASLGLFRRVGPADTEPV